MYVQVLTSRLIKQVSEPAVFLAVHTYFPDMFLVRLLSLSVPRFSSERTKKVSGAVKVGC